MKEFLITQLSDPQNWALFVILLIQLYKLIRPSLADNVAATTDKITGFLSWIVPSIFATVEGLEKTGAISKGSKLGTFFDILTKKASEQGIDLTGKNILAAKTMVEGLAQVAKLNPPEPPVSK